VNTPRPLFPDWPKLSRRLRAARCRILLSDFDGTLVAIRRLPDAVRMSKTMRRLLEQIRDAGSVVGVVSGRALEDVEGRVRVPGIWYVGSHGYRLHDPRGRLISLATPAERRRVQRAIRWLRPRVARLPGIRLDIKGASVALHYRTAKEPERMKAEAIVRRLLDRQPDLHLLAGKKVWELLPGESVDKWAAIRRLLEEEKRDSDRFLVYLGDDTTDESVFCQMRKGISIVVGRRTNTAARYYLRSMDEVRQFLRRWLEVAREEDGGKKRSRPKA
jgi:trehalose-phosphatase